MRRTIIKSRSGNASSKKRPTIARRWPFGAVGLLLLFLLAGCTTREERQREKVRSINRYQGPTIVEMLAPGRRGCKKGECLGPYWDFAHNNALHAAPQRDSAFRKTIMQLEQASRPKYRNLGPAALRKRIIEGLNIAFMLDGLDERALLIYMLDGIYLQNHSRYKLLFWDPLVGHFEALLLVPKSAPPYSAVIHLMGHAESEKQYAGKKLVQALLKRNYLILMPRLRAFDCHSKEVEIATHLLKQGFTLMGLRVYETLLMLKYLHHIPEVVVDRIGLVGHSGGSTIAQLTTRIFDGLAAMVSDHSVDYRNRCWRQYIHCETVPRLYPLHPDLNNLRTLKTPNLRVRYGFGDAGQRRTILKFLHRHLKPE